MSLKSITLTTAAPTSEWYDVPAGAESIFVDVDAAQDLDDGTIKPQFSHDGGTTARDYDDGLNGANIEAAGQHRVLRVFRGQKIRFALTGDSGAASATITTRWNVPG